jgi:hypothetical protein
MAIRHSLTLKNLPSVELGNTDLSIVVKDDGGTVGHLLISRGAIEWRPRNHSVHRRLGWKRFDSVMEEKGRPVKRATNPRGRRKPKPAS